MKRITLLICLLCTSVFYFGQVRPVNKNTLASTYSQVEIKQSLRDLIDKEKKESYFSDDFFNNYLSQILQNKQYSAKEKVQLFYLMQKKLGYAFVGVNYLPPKQNYYIFHLSKMLVLQKTMDAIVDAKQDANLFLDLVDAKNVDPIVSSNALLLATLIDKSKTAVVLRKLADGESILKSKYPTIINHYVCLSASLINDSIVMKKIKANIFAFKQECMIEDAFCAYYAKPAPLSVIKDYVMAEADPVNDLAVQTAMCVLFTKISDNAFQQNVRNLSQKAKEPWKKELLEKMANAQIPFNYQLTTADQLATKVWDKIQVSNYSDGLLISNGDLLEFDPN